MKYRSTRFVSHFLSPFGIEVHDLLACPTDTVPHIFNMVILQRCFRFRAPNFFPLFRFILPLGEKGKKETFVNHSLPARDLQSCTRIYSLVHLLSLSLPVQCNIYRFSHDVTSVIAVKLMYNSFLSI